jgi:hypothetical protein
VVTFQNGTVRWCGDPCARVQPRPLRWAQLDDEAGGRLFAFSDDDRWTDIPFSTNGVWTDLLNGDSVDIGGFRLTGQRSNSNWGRIHHQAA